MSKYWCFHLKWVFHTGLVPHNYLLATIFHIHESSFTMLVSHVAEYRRLSHPFSMLHFVSTWKKEGLYFCIKRKEYPCHIDYCCFFLGCNAFSPTSVNPGLVVLKWHIPPLCASPQTFPHFQLFLTPNYSKPSHIYISKIRGQVAYGGITKTFCFSVFSPLFSPSQHELLQWSYML